MYYKLASQVFIMRYELIQFSCKFSCKEREEQWHDQPLEKHLATCIIITQAKIYTLT